MSDAEILASFPNVHPGNYQAKSPESTIYNCIGWAVNDDQRWWWPQPQYPPYYWPPGLPRDVTVQNFVLMFSGFGYELCDNSTLERKYEKVAIYVDAAGTPTHAARQLDSGIWTSKLGRLEDIEHGDLGSLQGPSPPAYGEVRQLLRRRKRARFGLTGRVRNVLRRVFRRRGG